MFYSNFVPKTHHLDTIPACDRQTDRQTDRETLHDGTDLSMHSIARVIIISTTEVYRQCETLPNVSHAAFAEFAESPSSSVLVGQTEAVAFNDFLLLPARYKTCLRKKVSHLYSYKYTYLLCIPCVLRRAFVAS